MNDSNAIKEQVRDRIDLVELVSEHTTLKRRGRNHVGLCPFHQEKTPSFSVNAERQFFKCFGCGAGGDAFTFVQLRESVDFPEALRILADRAGIDLELRSSSPITGSSKADIARANAWAMQRFQAFLNDPTIGENARKYVADRGISDEMVRTFAVGLATGEREHALLSTSQNAGFTAQNLKDAGLCRESERGTLYDTFRDRLMFPIRDATGRCIGFGGRTLADDRAKYINTPETALFDKSRNLYGLDLARPAIERENCAIVVEGYTDCIACHQHGFTHTVAALGTAATEAHMALLRRYCENIILVFDSDAAGEAAADRALAVALKQNLNVRLVTVPGEKDPCDFLQHTGPQGFRDLLNSAWDALRFKWNRTQERYAGAEAPAERRDAVSEFMTLVADLAGFGVLDAIQQGIVIGQLAKLLSVSPEQVRRTLERELMRGKRRTQRSARPEIGRTARPRDAEQSAYVCMVEVLVNEPGLFGSVADCFHVDRMSDPGLRRIAGHVVDLAQSLGEFRLADLLDRLEDPADARLATDLALCGENIGNYEQTLAGAAERLRELDDANRNRQLTQTLKRPSAESEPLGDEEIRERLSRIGAHLAGRSGFAHRRAIEECSGEPSETVNAAEGVEGRI